MAGHLGEFWFLVVQFRTRFALDGCPIDIGSLYLDLTWHSTVTVNSMPTRMIVELQPSLQDARFRYPNRNPTPYWKSGTSQENRPIQEGSTY